MPAYCVRVSPTGRSGKVVSARFGASTSGVCQRRSTGAPRPPKARTTSTFSPARSKTGTRIAPEPYTSPGCIWPFAKTESTRSAWATRCVSASTVMRATA